MTALRISRPAAVRVDDLGAVGDGTTNDAAAIQAALDSVVAAGGGRVDFSPGKQYRITTGLTVSANVPVELAGMGNTGQDAVLGSGSSVIVVDAAGIVGFTYNTAGAATFFRGPTIRDLHIRAANTSATGGILFKRCNNAYMSNVVVSNFQTGYGVKSDGTGNVNQYHQYSNLNIHKCGTGLSLVVTGGLRMFGGYFDWGNVGTVQSGTTGISVDSNSSANRFVGVVLQEYETLVNVQGNYSEMYGCRFECWGSGAGKAAVVLNGANNGVWGGSFSNFQNSSAGVAILVDVSATLAFLMPSNILSVTTPINDTGTNTWSFYNVTETFPIGGLLKFGTDTIVSRKGVGQLKVQDNLYVASNLVTGETTTGSGVFFDGAAGPKMRAGNGSPEAVVTAPVGSIYVRKDGGANTTLYVKESGTGTTGWVAK